MIRTQAGKALRALGACDDLEKLLGNPDPRVRRAALDGMIDYNYWFGIGRSISASEIKTGPRSSEGACNVLQAAKVCLECDAASAVAVARMVRERIGGFGTGDLVNLVATPNSNPEGRPYGLHTTLDKLPPDQRGELSNILFEVYRPELIMRMTREKGDNQPLLDTIIDLTRLRKPDAGWKPVGKVPPAERVWRFTSFDPIAEKGRMHTRVKRRFRDIGLPAELKDWQKPEYDDSKWTQGKAPIGTGEFKQGNAFFPNKPDRGKGEFIVMRTTFEVDALDCDAYRLNILARQGFRVFLNGVEINAYGWWKDMPHYRPIDLPAHALKHLKTGTNVLAAYGNVEYDRNTLAPCGQMDLYIEGLKKSDLE